MAQPSDPSFAVLLALRTRGVAPTAALAGSCGLSDPDTEALLEGMAATGWVRHINKKGWMLLPAGRTEGEQLLAAELDAAGCREALHHDYRRFLELNPVLLKLCTDFQLRTVDGEQVMNDHSDTAYDAAVIQRLAALNEQFQPLAADLGVLLERLAQYGSRFQVAVERVLAGQRDWFTKPTCDSCHTVWFELHEDLLATLGIDRAAEQAAAGA